ncbi:Mrp family chromosome partitioning ATPase [Aminobacter lissarensis]|uniref:Mrp family chromosome partitioning ATPase n=1 Tax=Aminobacter carboxidus TaxID=376165 RepID=A0A8E1WH79_9HYPH|nr:tyrosine-protein kinase domain-containing protein [Aminobacter lissarensis]MBB6468482.1 Mrp family chromosome partitioning ATPase [Aminobacter lissarensis]
MLETRHPKELLIQQRVAPDASLYDWRWMIRSALKRLWLIIAGALLCAALAVGYVALRPAQYTASAVLTITNLRLSTSGEDAFFTESQFDPTFLETQIETIGSTPVISSVLQTLKLGGPDASNQQSAIKALRSGLAIQRLGQSNLVEIRYTSRTPQDAANIANEVARAYMAKQEADRSEAVQSASGWLRDRLREAGPKAQVMSAAAPPIDKSNPRGIVIIALAGIVGAAAGFVAALALAFLDRSFRRPEQLASVTGAECFGVIPSLADTGSSKPSLPLLSEIAGRSGTPEWQALRLANVSILPLIGGPHTKSLGVTSALPGEGKTVVAANLALHAVQMGKRVLLVDAQAYRPELSKLMQHAGRQGLIDYLEGRERDLAALVVEDARTGLDVLPYGQAGKTPPMLWSGRMENLLDDVTSYDVVVFDLPPLDAPGDLRASARFIASFLLVVEAGRVSDEALTAALSAIPSVWEKLAGSILNRCDPEPVFKWLPAFKR